MIPEQLALLLIKQKNHNKRFGEFEFEHFGDSNTVNNLKLILLGGDFSPKIFGQEH